MLLKDDVLKAKEIYLNNNEILIPMESRNVGYRFTKETLSWEPTKRWCSWKVHYKQISGEDALKLIKKWKIKKYNENKKLNLAIEFATKKHNGQLRKGTLISYIVHPLEVMQILYSMRADTNLMIAGILHDTLEDTNTTPEEIKKLFGKDVLNLVESNSEDKSKTWCERKTHTIKELSHANERIKKLF